MIAGLASVGRGASNDRISVESAFDVGSARRVGAVGRVRVQSGIALEVDVERHALFHLVALRGAQRRVVFLQGVEADVANFLGTAVQVAEGLTVAGWYSSCGGSAMEFRCGGESSSRVRRLYSWAITIKALELPNGSDVSGGDEPGRLRLTGRGSSARDNNNSTPVDDTGGGSGSELSGFGSGLRCCDSSVVSWSRAQNLNWRSQLLSSDGFRQHLSDIGQVDVRTEILGHWDSEDEPSKSREQQGGPHLVVCVTSVVK